LLGRNCAPVASLVGNISSSVLAPTLCVLELVNVEVGATVDVVSGVDVEDMTGGDGDEEEVVAGVVAVSSTPFFSM
jgi:hypothetical protein